jgi:hypothetical protein
MCAYRTMRGAFKVTTKGSTSTWETLREMYQTDPHRILTFGDPLAHISLGRVFKCDTNVLPTHDPLMFPKITGFNLKENDSVEIPSVIPGQLKLIGVSLRGGLDYTQSWAIPFAKHYQDDQRVLFILLYISLNSDRFQCLKFASTTTRS